MASIFTYESEPPGVISPWSGKRAEETNANPGDGQLLQAGNEMPLAISLAECRITKLEAEPQEGSTEYKLHLLLRPRRAFSATSTVQHVSGSYLSKSRPSPQMMEVESKRKTMTALAPAPDDAIAVAPSTVFSLPFFFKVKSCAAHFARNRRRTLLIQRPWETGPRTRREQRRFV